LITGIKQQSQPAFDFDLSKMVLRELPSPKATIANDNVLIWIFCLMGIAFLGGAIYLFQGYFDFFEGIRIMLIYLIAITAITVLAYLFIDMYKKYRRGMKVLDLY
jgi:predicted lipid-binding transport protein (Tim44 family)